MRICVVGLGKLGAPLAAILADRGHHVIGVDARPEVVELLNAGRTAIQEPGLSELIERNRSRLRATTDAAAAAADTDASFIVVPTPSTPHGTFSSRFVIDAIEAIGRGLRRSKKYHVVTVTSTVMPLSTDLEIRPALEAASGRIVGECADTEIGRKYAADLDQGASGAAEAWVNGYVDSFTSWSYAKDAFDKWAAAFAQRLRELQQS